MLCILGSLIVDASYSISGSLTSSVDPNPLLTGFMT